MTTLTGIIGFPTEHSLSPHVHHYWAKKYNVETEYKLFTTAPKRLRQTMLHMRKKNATGLNITLPHKQAVMEYLDAVDVLGTKIGAVNTIINKDGKLTGTNTDAYGFITNLRETLGDLTPYLNHAVVLGAGGASRAIVVGLQEAGAKKITLINRTFESAQNLAKEFSTEVSPWENLDAILATASLLINTTSLGMVGQPSLDIDLSQLPAKAAVSDIIYAPLETPLLTEAKRRGHPTVEGLGMLLYQAQKGFEAWHGILPEVTPELRAHVLEALA